MDAKTAMIASSGGEGEGDYSDDEGDEDDGDDGDDDDLIRRFGRAGATILAARKSRQGRAGGRRGKDGRRVSMEGRQSRAGWRAEEKNSASNHWSNRSLRKQPQLQPLVSFEDFGEWYNAGG